MTTGSTTRSQKGFTLIELLVAMAIIIGVGLLVFPTGVTFLQTQVLDEVSGNITNTLRRAHMQAVSQKNDSAFGVKVLSNTYVLFQGNSYDTRTQSEDEAFSFSNTLSLSGLDEVVFALLTGIPNATGTITVAKDTEEKNISINDHGLVQ